MTSEEHYNSQIRKAHDICGHAEYDERIQLFQCRKTADPCNHRVAFGWNWYCTDYRLKKIADEIRKEKKE